MWAYRCVAELPDRDKATTISDRARVKHAYASGDTGRRRRACERAARKQREQPGGELERIPLPQRAGPRRSWSLQDGGTPALRGVMARRDRRAVGADS